MRLFAAISKTSTVLLPSADMNRRFPARSTSKWSIRPWTSGKGMVATSRSGARSFSCARAVKPAVSAIAAQTTKATAVTFAFFIVFTPGLYASRLNRLIHNHPANRLVVLLRFRCENAMRLSVNFQRMHALLHRKILELAKMIGILFFDHGYRAALACHVNPPQACV